MDAKTVNSIQSYDPNLALASAHTIPANWYTSPAIAKLEKEAIFKNNWLYAGRSDQIQKSGDFVTTNIGGQPVLLVRNKDNELKAVANVCRHRAARIECREQGHTTRFRCRYHGWAYDLNGKLCGTPDFDGVENFDKSKQPLPEYRVRVWGPFIFVNLGDQESNCDSDFDDFMMPLQKYRDQMKIDQLVFYERKEWHINCNWKIFVDNYQDGGYHINTLHPDLATVVDMAAYDTELFEHASLQLSPLRPQQKPHNLNDVRSGKAFYWWYNPNLMINVYDKVMDINIVEPLTESSCRVIFDFYFSPEIIENQRDFISKSLKVSQKVQDEDIAICEEVQNNLATGAFQTGRFSVRREAGGHLFHNLVAQSLQMRL
jgi:choline monooxygenase